MAVLLNQFIPLFATVFILTWLVLPWWIKAARRVGLVGTDIHKTTGKQIAEMGGVITLLGFIVGIMGYIAMRVFLFSTNTNVSAILAILAGVLIAGVIGIIDDILGWKIGLKQWHKPVLTLLVAAPIMAVNAGTRIMSLPYIGSFDLGIMYPLIIIPGFIIVGANGFNMIAGYNGLEAGLGILVLGTLSYHSYITGTAWVAVVGLCMVSALAAFWIFNKFPASIFPGDTLTYTVGGLAGMLAIFGNLEKMFIILFVPYIIEFFLKLRGLFKKESFATIQEDGTLKPRYTKFYGIENIAVRILNVFTKTTEKKTVYLLYSFQAIFIALTFVI
jgi:UDP-N-acetylglucosamine--dolichyl-phosphate N-acetylglucosaminephosphotransferase